MSDRPSFSVRGRTLGGGEPFVIAGPLLLYFSAIGLVDSRTGLVLLYMLTTLPYALLVLKSFIDDIPLEYEQAAEMLGANRWQALRTVRVPSALPSFFAGLKISATYAVLAAVIGEWVGASSGLGLFLTRSQTAFRTDRVFVGVVVIAALSIAMFLAVQLLSRLTTPWDYATNRRESS